LKSVIATINEQTSVEEEKVTVEDFSNGIFPWQSAYEGILLKFNDTLQVTLFFFYFLYF
jgi:hypothetical protein